MELYLEQGDKEKERISRSSELRIEESRKERDHVVFCSTRKQKNKKEAFSLVPPTISAHVFTVLFPRRE